MKEIVGEANDLIYEHALSEELKLKDRAKKCGCANCRKDHEDADDRVDWVLGFGRWSGKLHIETNGTQRVLRLEPPSDDDDDNLVSA